MIAGMDYGLTDSQCETRMVATIVIGCRPIWNLVRGLLEPNDFVDPVCRWMWQVAEEISQEGGNVGNVDLYLDKCRSHRRDWREVALMIAHASQDFPCLAADAEHYARIVRINSVRRRLQDLMERGCSGMGEDLAVEIRRFQNELTKLEKAAANISETSSVWEALEKLREPEADHCMSTGLSNLDRVLMGGLKQELTVIAARPGGGKSALAASIARNVAMTKKKVLFISLEMPAHQIYWRVMSQQTGIPYRTIAKRETNDDEMQRILEAAMRIETLQIVDIPPRHIGDVFKLCDQYTPDLLVVDYLGLLPIDRRKDRRQEVEANCNAMMQLKSEYRIPVILLSQLNRENAKSNTRPTLTNLRDTGASEQNAENVLFLHPERPDSMSTVCDVDLIVAKQRNGPMCTLQLHWTPATMRFDTIDNRHIGEYHDDFDQFNRGEDF